MTIEEAIQALENSGLRKIEGDYLINNTLYHVKAYKIGIPHELIRIDIKEFTEKEIRNARRKS